VEMIARLLQTGRHTAPLLIEAKRATERGK
jgi:hypothetical protein